MNRHRYLQLVALGLAWAPTACVGDASPEAEASRVEPGTTTRTLGPLYFERSADAHNNNGTPIPFTACSLAENAGSIALIEITGEGEYVPRLDDCSGPYSSNARRIPAQVYGVAAGEALPPELTLVHVFGLGLPNQLSPRAGVVWLATLRQSEGQWFITKALPVALDASGSIAATAPSDSYELSDELPEDFDALSARLTEKIEALPSECPVEAQQRLEDHAFHERYYNPVARPESNCHPDDGPQQQHPNAIDEEELPPSGGTEDSLQP